MNFWGKYVIINLNNNFKMLEFILVWLVDIGMAVGPILGYVSQYRLIKATKSVGSFSIDICGILLFANILRLNFYIFKQYQITLVFQSIIMITMQIILLRECCKYPSNQEDPNIAEEIEPALQESRGQCTQRVQEFWRWDGFEKYGVAVLFFVFCTFTLSLILKFTPISKQYGELVGLVALMSQSILILPQIIKNVEKQSTKGLSHMLVILNLSGDVFKLTYFLVNDQPFQFILCGIIQVVLDSFVILQIFYYSYKEKRGAKSTKKESDTPIKPSMINHQKQLDPIDSQANLDYKVQSLESQRQNERDEKLNKKENKDVIKQTVNKLKSMKQQIINQQNKQNKENEEQKNYEELAQEIDSDEDKGSIQTKNSQINSQKNDDIKNRSQNQQIERSNSSKQKQSVESG